MRARAMIGILVMFLVALAIPAGADENGRPLAVVLLGANEAPGPGDPDGSGTAHIELNQGHGQVCWVIEVTNVENVTAAHIHVAPAGSPGPVVVPLSPVSSGCTTADRDLIKAIRQNPSAYYVNVHSTTFPAGAVRGQLAK